MNNETTHSYDHGFTLSDQDLMSVTGGGEESMPVQLASIPGYLASILADLTMRGVEYLYNHPVPPGGADIPAGGSDPNGPNGA